jgi:hypothetical protein
MGCRVEPAVNTSLGHELLRLVLPALLMQVVQTVGWVKPFSLAGSEKLSWQQLGWWAKSLGCFQP